MSVVGSPFAKSDGATRSIHPFAVCVARIATSPTKRPRAPAQPSPREQRSPRSRRAGDRRAEDRKEHQVSGRLPVRKSGVAAQGDQRERRRSARSRGTAGTSAPRRAVPARSAPHSTDDERHPDPRQHVRRPVRRCSRASLSRCSPPRPGRAAALKRERDPAVPRVPDEHRREHRERHQRAELRARARQPAPMRRAGERGTRTVPASTNTPWYFDSIARPANSPATAHRKRVGAARAAA